MSVLSELIDKKDCLLAQKNIIQRNITQMYQDKYNIFEGRNSNRSDIEKRILAYREFFTTYIGE
jgi:hypothetical protein